ncbi:DUF354 domain-containing protein [Gracilimonas sp.]|uniref:DUF354 domain-containing protein n=1 Tax=Gracilimonas sp. TaxID=1974203 RepID=UPI0032EEDD38
MRVLFHLGHPAHFHLFKFVIKKLIQNDHEVDIVIKEKDVLKKLLDDSNIPYENILPEGKSAGKIGLFQDLIVRGKNIYRYCKKNNPNLLIGTSADISYLGKLLKIPSINVNEDDASVVPMYAWMAYPFATSILSPDCCNNGRWENKTTKYPGYHELAYLHPDHFKPDKNVINKYLKKNNKFIIVRFAGLTAHHDENVRGINDELASRLIKELEQFGQILITSERKLSDKFEPYRLSIDPLDIHHFLAFASLVIGDSQTMSAEAAVLGTPYIRYNDFVGKIGYLKELEEKYGLGFGITPDQPQNLVNVAIELASKNASGKEVFETKRKLMLKEKINTADYLYNYISNFLSDN